MSQFIENQVQENTSKIQELIDKAVEVKDLPTLVGLMDPADWIAIYSIAGGQLVKTSAGVFAQLMAYLGSVPIPTAINFVGQFDTYSDLVSNGAGNQKDIAFVLQNENLVDGFFVYYWDSDSLLWRRISFFEEDSNGHIISTTGVSGNYSMDLKKGSLWVLELSGTTTLDFINWPSATETRTVTALVKGDFALGFEGDFAPSANNNAYKGDVWNWIHIEIVGSLPGNISAIYTLENLNF